MTFLRTRSASISTRPLRIAPCARHENSNSDCAPGVESVLYPQPLTSPGIASRTSCRGHAIHVCQQSRPTVLFHRASILTSILTCFGNFDCTGMKANGPVVRNHLAKSRGQTRRDQSSPDRMRPRPDADLISRCNLWGCHDRCKNPSYHLQKSTCMGRSCLA